MALVTFQTVDGLSYSLTTDVPDHVSKTFASGKNTVPAFRGVDPSTVWTVSAAHVVAWRVDN